jgi:ribonucleoside-diphosphate reductase alpha chain
MGLKTTYYLRTMAASQVEKSTVSVAEHGQTHIRGGSGEAVAEQAQAVEMPLPQPVPVMAAATEQPGAAAEQIPREVLDIESMAYKVEPTPISSMNPMFAMNSGSASISQQEFKACRLDDPECEACQ